MALSTLLNNRFEVQQEVARGGMGTVFRGIDRQTGQAVAIKTLHADGPLDAQRFRREASVLAQLTHPGIVRYLAHGALPNGCPYLVMEWLEAQSLNERLQNQGLLPSESIDVVRKIASAVAGAHQAGLVHRDLKPSNVLVSRGEPLDVKVVDFGVARFAVGRPGARTYAITATGAIIGTPGYMAPEQIRGARNVDARVDIFAMGCLLYLCLTGRSPFGGDNEQAVFAKILLWEPPSLGLLAPHLPEGLVALVGRALSKDPERRPADGHVFAEELTPYLQLPGTERVIAGQPITATATLAGESSTSEEGNQGLSFINLVFVGGAPPQETDGPGAPSPKAALPIEIDSLLASSQSKVETLPDGALLMRFGPSRGARQQAAQAAKCALELSRLCGDRPLTMTTGVIDPTQSADAEAKLIDTAARQLHDATLQAIFSAFTDAPTSGIVICELTASLLGPEFVVVNSERGLLLRDGS
jgi:serine/threonine protein kinase